MNPFLQKIPRKSLHGALTKDNYLEFQKYNREYIQNNHWTADQIESAYLNSVFKNFYDEREDFDSVYANFKKLDVNQRRKFLTYQVGAENVDNYNDAPIVNKPTQKTKEQNTSAVQTESPEVTTTQNNTPIENPTVVSEILMRKLFSFTPEDIYSVSVEDVSSASKLTNAFAQMQKEQKKFKPSFWERAASGFDQTGQKALDIDEKETHYNEIRKAINGEGISDWVKKKYGLSDQDVFVYNKNMDKIKNPEPIRVEDVKPFAENTKSLAFANSPIFQSKQGTKWLKEGRDFTDEDLAEQYREYLINTDLYGEAIANHKLDNYFRDIVNKNETFWDNLGGYASRFVYNFAGGAIEGGGFLVGLATAPFRNEDNVKGLNAWQNYWQKAFINDVTTYGHNVAKYGNFVPERQKWAKAHGDMSLLMGATRPSRELDGDLADQLWSLHTIGEIIGNAGYTAEAIFQGGVTSAAIKYAGKGARRVAGKTIKNMVLHNKMSAKEGADLLRKNIKTINSISGYTEVAVVPQIVSSSEATANALETYDGVTDGLKNTLEQTINEYYNYEESRLLQEANDKIEAVLNNPELRKPYEDALINEYNKQADAQYREAQRRNPEANIPRLLHDYKAFPDWEENLSEYIRVSIYNEDFVAKANEVISELNIIRDDAYERLEGEARLAAVNSGAYTQLTNVILDGMFRRALYPLSTQRHIKNLQDKIVAKTNKILKRDPEAINFKKKFEIDPATKEIVAKKPTKGQKFWAVSKEGLSEFTAENQQTAADKASQGVAKYDIAQYIDARINGVADEDWGRDYSENYSQFFKGLVDAELGTNLSGFGGSAEDVKEVWFSSFMGLAGALTGTPIMNRNFNVTQGRQPGESVKSFLGRVLPISYRTPFIDGVRAVNNTYEANKRQAEQLNEFLANGGASLLEKGNGAKTWAAMAEAYADENNDFGMKVANFKSLYESMAMLHQLQGTEVGKALLNELQQVVAGDEHAKALINEMVNEFKYNERAKVKEGTQVENEDVEALQEDNSGDLTDEEIAEQIQTNAALALQVYEDMEAAEKEVKSATQGGATDDVIQALTSSQMLEKYISGRQEIVEKKLGGNTSVAAPKDEVDYLVDFGTQEKAKAAYEKSKQEVKELKKKLRKTKKSDYIKELLIDQMRLAMTKSKMAKAKAAMNTEWDSNIVYSAEEIMAMNPQDRERIIKNKSKLSKEQQAIIDELIVNKSIENPNFMSDIEDASKIDGYLTKIRKEFADVISNPKDMNIYAGRARQDRYNRNLKSKYEHLGKIEDYALFAKVFEDNINKDMQDSPMARRVIEEALKNNENYKRYRQLKTNTARLKAALNSTKGGGYSLFQGLPDRQKQLAEAVIDWLAKNNIPTNLGENEQMVPNTLVTDDVLKYLVDNIDKLTEDLSNTLETSIDGTEAINAYKTVLGIKEEFEAAREEAKAIAEAIKAGNKKDEEAPEDTEDTSRQEETNEAMSEETEVNKENEEEEAPKANNDLQNLEKEGILNKELLADLEELGNIDEDLIFPVSELLKVSMLTKGSIQLPDSWHSLLRDLIDSKPNSYSETLERFISLVVAYDLVNMATTLHFQQYLEIVNDAVTSYDEEEAKKRINYQIVYASNVSSNTLSMAEVANHLGGVLGELYKAWGVDNYLYPSEAGKAQSRRESLRKAEVYYVAMPKSVVNEIPNFKGNPLKEAVGYPIAAVVVDEKGPLTVNINGKETKVQPIGFIISNERLNRPGGIVATAIRKAAFSMMPEGGFTENTVITQKVKNEKGGEEHKPVTTQGVVMKQFGKSISSNTPKSLKTLFEDAKKKMEGFRGKFFNNVYVGPTRNKEGKQLEGTSIYYALDTGQIESGRGNSVISVMLLKKPLSEVTAEIGVKGKEKIRMTFEEVIMEDGDAFTDFFMRFNSRVEGYILTLAEASEDDNIYAVAEDAPESAKKIVSKNLEELQKRLNKFIYLKGKDYKLSSKLEEGNQNIYIEYSPDNINMVRVKLFTIKSANPDVTVDNFNLAAQLKEALKDSTLREIFHFQIDHSQFMQEKNGTITHYPKGYKVFNEYFGKIIEEDLLEARVSTLVPTALPTTNVVSGSVLADKIGQETPTDALISERLREMQKADNEKQADDKSNTQPENTDNAAPVENPSSDEANDEAGTPDVPETDVPETLSDVEDIDFGDLIDPALRVASSEETSLFDKGKELAWLKKVLPQMSRDELIQFKEGLIRLAGKPDAWGAVSNALTILSDKAAEGTVYHEAFHVVFQNILDKDRQDKVLKEARELYPNIESNKALEEKLADAFMDYVKNNAKTSTTIGGKIKEFFEELFTKIIYWVSGKNAIQQLYRDINNGKFAYSDIHIRRAETLMDVRESDITDFMTAIKNTDANSIGTLWENIFGVPITEEQVKSLKSASFDPAIFDAVIQTQVRKSEWRLAEKLNDTLYNVKSYDNTDLQKEINTLTKYKNGEKLSKDEKAVIREYIKREGRNIYWATKAINRLNDKIKENNSKREELLKDLKSLAIRQQVLKQMDTKRAIIDVLTKQRENFRNNNINGKVIAEQIFSPKTKVSLREVSTSDLSIERYSPEALNNLNDMGMTAEEFNSYPEELKERIRHCRKL